MTVTTRPVPRREADRLERDLLARLGLGGDANTEEIEAAHDRLVEFLNSAPRDLHQWAAEVIASADEAYALLSDQSSLDIAQAAAPTATTPSRTPAARTPAARTGVAATQPRSTADRPAVPPAPDEDDEDLPEELQETEGAGMPVRRPSRRAAPRHEAGTSTVTISTRMLRRALMGIGGIAVALVIVFGVYSAGASAVPGVNGTPAPEASAGAQVDEAQVSALMQKIAADPNDTDSLTSLGNIYFDAGDYATAITFMERVVAIDPANVDALVGLGAAQFNTGDSASAKTQWEKAISLDPTSQEAYFDLGFLYLNQNPPDMDSVVANWNKVVDIDPTSDLAQSVKTHLDAFASQPPGSAAPSGSAAAASPGTAASPATTPSAGN